MAHYLEHPPCAELRRYVACYWTRSSSASVQHPLGHRVLPDGCMDILFTLDRRASRSASRVIGAMTESITVPDTPDEESVAVRFLPGGAYPFVHVPARELTDQSVELAALVGAQARGAEEQILDAADRVAALEAFLLDRLRRARPDDSRLLALTRALWHKPTELTIDDLSARSGISARQLERWFLQQVGLGPKFLLRVLRFQRARQAAASAPRPDWAAIAADHGYFDQAHLIRDFRKLTGQTPRSYFLQRMSVFSNSSAGPQGMLPP